MYYVRVAFQVIIALGLLNVWLIRSNQSTPYRGGNAHSIREEFAAYGLPVWAMYLVGTLKIGAALTLLAGIWIPALVFPAALLICFLMIGALAMHQKVRDSGTKYLPALMVLALSVVVCWLSRHY